MSKLKLTEVNSLIAFATVNSYLTPGKTKSQ